MVKRLLDKVVIITGATSGIGLEIARFSISQGANVVISGRRENEGKKIVNQLGERCQFIKCDVLHEDQICTLVEQTFNHYGKIDAIFNNAGAPDFVRNIEDISNLLKSGADKVSINTAAVTNKKIITESANKKYSYRHAYYKTN